MRAKRSVNYAELPTEQRNLVDPPLDVLSPTQLVDLIHRHDRKALASVRRCRKDIALVIGDVAAALEAGGRLIYVGAGTSGRLGVLDASECPPTFNTKPRQVVGIIAGGARALRRAVEGAEDDVPNGARAIDRLKVSSRDVVCGITASGITPFVLGALARAKKLNATTALITCGDPQRCRNAADRLIHLDVGPEVLTGSTRMKSGLATKAVLHTITTGAMILTGKVYENFMVDVQPTNRKLIDRATRMIGALTALSGPKSRSLLKKAQHNCKNAVVMHHLGLNLRQAAAHLARHKGRLRAALENSPQLE